VSFSSPRPSPPAAADPAEDGILATEIKPEALDWLLPGWIPKGHQTVVIGEPDTGKSTFFSWLMTQAKRPMLFPGNEERLGGQLLKRLQAHGVDLKTLKVMHGRHYPFGGMHEWIIKVALAHRADLILADPIDDYFDDDLDEDKNRHVRPFLEKVEKIAGETGAALVYTRHPGKDPLNLDPGSRAWRSVPRVRLHLMNDGDFPPRRILRALRCGVAKSPPATYFDLVESQEAHPVFRLGDPVNPVAIELAKDMPDAMDRSQYVLACALLEGMVEPYPGVPGEAVYKRAKAEGIPDRTVRWAKKSLGYPHHWRDPESRHRCFWYKP